MCYKSFSGKLKVSAFLCGITLSPNSGWEMYLKYHPAGSGEQYCTPSLSAPLQLADRIRVQRLIPLQLSANPFDSGTIDGLEACFLGFVRVRYSESKGVQWALVRVGAAAGGGVYLAPFEDENISLCTTVIEAAERVAMKVTAEVAFAELSTMDPKFLEGACVFV